MWQRLTSLEDTQCVNSRNPLYEFRLTQPDFPNSFFRFPWPSLIYWSNIPSFVFGFIAPGAPKTSPGVTGWRVTLTSEGHAHENGRNSKNEKSKNQSEDAKSTVFTRATNRPLTKSGVLKLKTDFRAKIRPGGRKTAR